MIRVIAFAAAGLLATYAVRRVMAAVAAQRAPVRAGRPQTRQAVTKLRQDPRTGIYYPEE